MHRPRSVARRSQRDGVFDVDVVELFAGFGGLTRGLEAARVGSKGFTAIVAANHNPYKIDVHAMNHPWADHLIADTVDDTRGDYRDPQDLPRARVLAAGVSCTNHSSANSQRVYRESVSLFDIDDPDYEARVTRSERERATGIGELQYVRKHQPDMVLIECTTELQAWGDALPGTRGKVGDGSMWRWWLAEHDRLGYDHQVLYLNTQFFGVPQSRDRLFVVFWRKGMRRPDLDHRPDAHCGRCDAWRAARQAWKTGVPRSGRTRYGEQYIYVCETCGSEVVPPRPPAAGVIDWSNLGTRIGDRERPLAASTMARVERAIKMFASFPAILMPAKGVFGSDRHPWLPMSTRTGQQDATLVSTGALTVLAGNTFERAGSTCRSRPVTDVLPTQHATMAHGLLAPPSALVTYRNQPPQLVDRPLPTQGSHAAFSLLTPDVGRAVAGAWFKQNGGPADTAMHPVSDPLGTLTARDTTGMCTFPFDDGDVLAWRETLASLTAEECYLRMLSAIEVGRACGVNPHHDFLVYGSERDQVDGFGNMVTPQVATWIGERMLAVLDAEDPR